MPVIMFALVAVVSGPLDAQETDRPPRVVLRITGTARSGPP
jgi:hypothetical protein